MLQLQINNINTDIVGDLPSGHLIALRDRMSFRPDGFQFSPNYRRFGGDGRRFWDGWKRLLKINTKRTYFPSGLLSIAKKYLIEKSIPFESVDLRVIPAKNLNIQFNTKDFSLYHYQIPVVERSKKQTRGVMVCATGSGKTLISAAMIADLGVAPFLFLVTSIDLLEQTARRFSESLLINGVPLKIGRIGGGVVDIADVNVMTVQTAVRALGKKFVKFDSDTQDEKINPSLLQQHGPAIRSLLKNCAGVICDECLTRDSVVITKDGTYCIDELSNKIGQEVLSFDGTHVVWKKITNFYCKGVRKTLKIASSNGRHIRCTAEHLINTNNGWVRAESIKPSDLVLCLDDANKQVLNTSHVSVESVEESGEEEVFDISVEDTHCFFANGLLVHNCQHWRADVCQLVTNSLEKCYYRYGASATPWRDNGDDLLIQSCFGKTICEVKASDLITSGDLVKPTIYMIHLKGPKSKFSNWQGIYKDCIAENDYYNTLVARLATEYISQKRRVLILVQKIEHGKILESYIDGSRFVSGSSNKKTRSQAIEDLTKGKIKCILASQIFDEGIDCKPLDTLILAGGGKSPTRALQRIGRAIRKYPGKESAVVVDFMLYQKYLLDHAKSRIKIYQTEPEFKIEHIFNSG